MNNTQSKVFMTGVWINYNIPWILRSKLLLLVSSAALLCISHARSLAANTLCSSHKVGRLFAWRGESMTSRLWTVWPCKNRLWWEWVHKGARPPQAATIYSLSYSPLTPPHRGLHHRWHYFLCWKHILLLETFNAPLFFLRPLGLYFPPLSCKRWGVSPKIHGHILKS